MPRMTGIAATLTAMIAFAPAMAAGGGAVMQPRPTEADTLDALRWNARPVVVLGDAARVAAQIETLQAEAAALAERDVVILTDGPGAAPLLKAAGRADLAVFLIGKDGGVKMSRSEPVAAADIIGLIDTMPMRRREAAGG